MPNSKNGFNPNENNDKELNRKAVIEAVANVELEGRKVPDFMKNLLHKYISGEITEEEYDKTAMEFIMKGKKA